MVLLPQSSMVTHAIPQFDSDQNVMDCEERVSQYRCNIINIAGFLENQLQAFIWPSKFELNESCQNVLSC